MPSQTVLAWVASIAVTTLLSLLLASIRGVRSDLKEYMKSSNAELQKLTILVTKHDTTLYAKGGVVDVQESHGDRIGRLERVKLERRSGDL